MVSQNAITTTTLTPPTREIPTGAPLEDTEDNPNPSSRAQCSHCRRIVCSMLAPFWMGIFILIPCLLGGIILLSVCFLSVVVLTTLATCAFFIAPESMSAWIAERNATANPTARDSNDSVHGRQVDSVIQNQEELKTWLILKTITTSTDNLSSTNSTISIDSLTTKCCDICMMEYSIGQVIGQSCHNLECDHYFHKDCILEWLQMKPTCPCCRRHFDKTIVTLQEAGQLQEPSTDEQPNSSNLQLTVVEPETTSSSHVTNGNRMALNADGDLNSSTIEPVLQLPVNQET